MSEEVVIQSTDDAGPTLEQQAAAQDAQAAETIDAGGDPTTPERPEWLQEKYLTEDRSIDDAIAEQAKAYVEAQKKLSERPTGDPTTMTESLTSARDEFAKEGKLSEDTVKQLTDAGIPQELIDHYTSLPGQQDAIAELHQIKVEQAAGGKEQHDSLLEWGAENLSSEEIDVFNEAYTSGDLTKASVAIKNLQARYQVANGSPATQTLKGNTATAAGVQPFSSMQEVKTVMQDPKYRNGDKAFHDKVQKRLEVTNMATLPPRA